MDITFSFVKSGSSRWKAYEDTWPLVNALRVSGVILLLLLLELTSLFWNWVLKRLSFLVWGLNNHLELN